MNNKNRLLKSLMAVDKSHDRLLLARAMRMWVEETEDINIYNYFWRRYFTNDFILYIIENGERVSNQ